MKSIAVIDYGMGNLHSVAKALEHVCPDTRVYVTNDAAKIESCDRVLLPGVGAIRDCMAEIKRLGVDQIVADQMGKKQCWVFVWACRPLCNALVKTVG